jgi:hypothetical protein
MKALGSLEKGSLQGQNTVSATLNSLCWTLSTWPIQELPRECRLGRRPFPQALSKLGGGVSWVGWCSFPDAYGFKFRSRSVFRVGWFPRPCCSTYAGRLSGTVTALQHKHIKCVHWTVSNREPDQSHPYFYNVWQEKHLLKWLVNTWPIHLSLWCWIINAERGRLYLSYCRVFCAECKCHTTLSSRCFYSFRQ